MKPPLPKSALIANRFGWAPILKPPLKLIGAKTKIRDILYEVFPEYDSFYEPFMGTGGVFLGRPAPNSVEYIGDLNQYAVAFYRDLRDNSEVFWDSYQYELKKLQAGGRERFETIRDRVTTSEGVEQSVFFYLITKTCMNGIWRLNQKGKCNSSYCGQTNGRGFMDRIWFNAVCERIQKTYFIDQDYKSTLSRAKSSSIIFDKNRAFVFLDPPYSRCKTTYNGVSWADEHFIELSDELKNAKYKWLLTLNDNEFIRSLFQGYSVVEHNVNYSCSQINSGRGEKPELLIANYDIESKWVRVKEHLDASKKKTRGTLERVENSSN